ncbi:hypothetical protein PS15m_003610 [Mucor circinelloides]
MTSDTASLSKPKQKRSRKLPRRAVLDADFVAPSSNRVIDDLLLERAPSQHDRVILSELWGGNDPHFQRSIMPAVSIGKPKRTLHGDTLAKSKTYKDMLKEKHKDDWVMDLSNMTFVPPTAKGKHIRSSNESTPPVTEASDESASELGTDNLAPLDESDILVDQLKNQKTDITDTKNMDGLEAGNQDEFKERETNHKLADALDNDESEKPIDTLKDTSSKQVTNGTSKDEEHNHQKELSQSSAGNHNAGQEETRDMSKASISEIADKLMNSEAEELDGKDMEQDNDFMHGYSDDDYKVDQDITEKLQQLPVIADNIDDGSDDVTEIEMPPATDENTTSKEEISQAPQPAKTSPSISSSNDYIHEQRLVPEAYLSGNNVGDEDDQHLDVLKQIENPSLVDLTTVHPHPSTPSEKGQEETHHNIPLDDTTVPSNDDKPESDEDQEELMDIEDEEQQQVEIEAPVSRQMFVSETQNSAMISDKVSQLQKKKPLLNLDQPVYDETIWTIKSNPKIIKKWLPNQKHHRILNVLKTTTALNWIEDGYDDIRKKDMGLIRKRQLETRFSKPFVIKKRIKNCWFIESK